MSEVGLHDAFSALVIDEPPLPDFLTRALERGRRRRSAAVASGCAVVVGLAVVAGGGVSTDRNRSAVPLSSTMQTQLLAIADRAAAGCGGPAEHVQVASSTRAVANEVTSGAEGMDDRPVWVLLITGGPFNCPHTGPSGAPPLPPAKDVLMILDAATMQSTDGGFGDHESLNGLGPVTDLR